ncbi:uncharacterized protein ASCRUDRAFT_78205 [Ascoidea rubescens DSM 1968]|uniref:Uncharacterized protein n=1 Tax=Ascoidea rubescens DSM 1968 TaxID=1344418 RepID=A0A1D2V9F8_9ASCO|nr:hypothetical protein ASCRUDRAFT_78205 [Ascoidea rubescens DSM 1968]ODV58093.1 hypothetical protein ASCRUDRAFT_78205 [Ascoidea rubescens DSM 1968]
MLDKSYKTISLNTSSKSTISLSSFIPMKPLSTSFTYSILNNWYLQISHIPIQSEELNHTYPPISIS